MFIFGHNTADKFLFSNTFRTLVFGVTHCREFVWNGEVFQFLFRQIGMPWDFFTPTNCNKSVRNRPISMKGIFNQVNIGFDLTSGHKIGWSQILDFDHMWDNCGSSQGVRFGGTIVARHPESGVCQDLRFGDTKVSGSNFDCYQDGTNVPRSSFARCALWRSGAPPP